MTEGRLGEHLIANSIFTIQVLSKAEDTKNLPRHAEVLKGVLTEAGVAMREGDRFPALGCVNWCRH